MDAKPVVVQIPVEVGSDPIVFTTVSRGYDPKQVDAHVAALEQELAELRWEHEDLAAQRAELAAQRAEQAAWTPSFEALGARVRQIIDLAEEEASSLRASGEADAREMRERAAAFVAERDREQEVRYAARREELQREIRVLEYSVESRRKLAETDIAQRRRDAEIAAASEISRAESQAADIRERATRDADRLLADARAEVATLEQERDTLTADLAELSARIAAVVDRSGRGGRRSG